jgi:hypothetical protein
MWYKTRNKLEYSCRSWEGQAMDHRDTGAWMVCSKALFLPLVLGMAGVCGDPLNLMFYECSVVLCK